METIEKEKIKISTIEDAIISLNSYIKIANSYVQDNLQNKEILHMGLIIDKMEEEMDKIRPYFDAIQQ